MFTGSRVRIEVEDTVVLAPLGGDIAHVQSRLSSSIHLLSFGNKWANHSRHLYSSLPMGEGQVFGECENTWFTVHIILHSRIRLRHTFALFDVD